MTLSSRNGVSTLLSNAANAVSCVVQIMLVLIRAVNQSAFARVNNIGCIFMAKNSTTR